MDLTVTPFRKTRTFSIKNIDTMPVLPERLKPEEVKPFGIVTLIHADPDKRSIPWLMAGWYRYVSDGKLYLLEVSRTPVRGDPVCMAIYQPIFRVPAIGRPVQ